MNFSRLVIFLMFWNFICATMHPALIFDITDDKLVEVSKFDDEAICKTCISACPVDPDSSTEKLLNNTVSITKRSTFSRNVYPKNISAKEMEIEICKGSFTPALAWNYDTKTYEVGYELYYKRGEISMYTDIDYEDFVNKEIEENYTESSNKGKESGGEDPNETDESDEFDIAAYLKKKLAIDNPSAEKLINITVSPNFRRMFEFGIPAEPEKKWTFNWIYVFILNISNDRRLKYIMFDDVSENNFQTVTINYYCKTYFGEDGTEIENTDGPEKEFVILGFEQKSETKQKSPKFVDRLVKAQIIPARMFGTQAAQEATCVYLNFAFIWETIANEMLKKIDLFVYAIHLERLHYMEFYFGVYDYLQGFDLVAQKETASLDNRFSMPQVIFRLLVFPNSNLENYGVVIIIHNDLEPIKDTDRICSTEDELEGWEYIKNTNSATGFSYTCPQTEEVLCKLGFDKRFIYENVKSRKLDKFPITGEHSKFLEGVRKRFERIINLNVVD